jgi:phage FluMu protein Com
MECPRCKNGNVHTESGEEIVRTYENGELIDATRSRLPRKLFCPKCQEIFDIGKYPPTSRPAKYVIKRGVKYGKR